VNSLDSTPIGTYWFWKEDLPSTTVLYNCQSELTKDAQVWQATILSLFLHKKLIDQARVNMLKDWKHSGFSIESETRLFSKADREALGQYVVRGATCAEKIQYDPASDTVFWTAAPKGFYKGKTETFKGF
jgi:hypothetical protein